MNQHPPAHPDHCSICKRKIVASYRWFHTCDHVLCQKCALNDHRGDLCQWKRCRHDERSDTERS